MVIEIASSYELRATSEPGSWIARSSRLVARSALPTAVSRRNHSPILTRARQAIEHTPGGERDVADGLFSVPLAMQVGCHDTQDIGTLVDEDDARIVADAFESAGLVGDFQIVGQIALYPTVFVGGEVFEEIGRHLFVQDLAAVERLQQVQHLVWRGDIVAAVGRGLEVHHFAAKAEVAEG